MRLLMFQHDSGPRLAVMRDRSADEVVDLVELSRSAGVPLPADLLGLINAGDEGLRRVRSLLAASPSLPTRKLEEISLLQPLAPTRGDVLAIGRNYGRHARESAQAWGEEVKPPTVFTKAQTSLTSPHASIAIDPQISDKIDWEVELGVVIGRQGLNIAAGDALDYVFGYTVVNDVTARDMQEGLSLIHI